MKQLLLFACLSLFTFGLNAQVFVNINAAAGGDGTSWATANNDLNVALRTAAAGSEVWIAQGTYVTPDTVSFFIDKEMTVIGGFEGTETMASEADPTKFETILSGDVMGNDPVGSYDSLMFLDNNRVLLVTDTNAMSAYTVTLKGFTVTNGAIANDEGSAADIVAFSGGGILSDAKVDISDVTFKACRAAAGSAYATYFGRAAGSRFDNISLEGNHAANGRKFLARLTSDIQVTNSTFDDQNGAVANSGFVHLIDVQDVLIENCSFKNQSINFSGGGVRAFDCDDIVLRKCSFDSLTSGTGGGVFFFVTDGFDVSGLTRDLDDHIIDSCTFTFVNTPAVGGSVGGAIRMDDVNVTLRGSTLTNCDAPSNGGAIYFQTGEADLTYNLLVENTEMIDCDGSGFGGAMIGAAFGSTMINTTFDGLTLSDSETVPNGNGTSLGSAYYGQGANSSITVRNSTFTDNDANQGVIVANGSMGVEVHNSSFTNSGNPNTAFRGALTLFVGGGTGVTIDSTTFTNSSIAANSGALSGGAAVYLLGGSSTPIPVSVTNSTFESNSTTGGANAAGLYLIGGMDVTVDNCDFFNNNSSGEGGGIAVNTGEATRDTTDGVIAVTLDAFTGSVSNSNFYGNTAGTQGGGISTQGSVVDLTNNTFVLNQVGSDGASGGAIIFNGNAPRIDMSEVMPAGTAALTAKVIHNTFFDNLRGTSETAVGDHLAVYQPGETVFNEGNSMTLELLNNAFVTTNPDDDIIAIEADTRTAPGFEPIGDITVISLGGNFFNGTTDSELAIMNDDDIIDTDIDEDSEFSLLFVDPFADNADVADMDLFIPDPLTLNPLISGGVVSDLVPDSGQDGNPRGDAPDIGAYEADQGATSVKPVEESGLNMSFFPNPTANFVNIKHEDASIQRFNVIIADQAGRILRGETFNGNTNVLDLTSLPTGVYNLQLIINGNVYSKQIVKQ